MTTHHQNKRNKATVWVLFAVMMWREVYYYNQRETSFLQGTKTAETRRVSVERAVEDSPQPVIRDGLRLSQPTTTPKTFKVDPRVAQMYQTIDSVPDVERCKKYGFTYNATRLPQKRRIFFGALVADESEALLRMHAAETYNVYHTVALVESNRTFMNTDRTPLRWANNKGPLHTLATSGIFGNQTTVAIDEWFDASNLVSMQREVIMRDSIVQRWLEEGIRPDDIAIVGDLDEVFSRDFLRAAQSCQIPDFDNEGGDCERPKIVARTVQYEGMPTCIKERRWFHPDMILGHCVEGVGDPTGRIMAVRKHQRQHGSRLAGYGWAGNYLPEIKSLGRYPLWNTQDFRNIEGAARIKSNSFSWGIAFHFHNFFDDFATLRHKYVTYGHADASKATVKLSEIEADIDLLVRCVHNISNHDPRVVANQPRDTGNGGTKPIYFRNLTYVREREQLVKSMLAEDEKVYGSAYYDNDVTNVTKKKNQTNPS